MLRLFIKLILIYEALFFTRDILNKNFIHKKENQIKVEMRARDILKINWKPTSVFPEEAQRFR